MSGHRVTIEEDSGKHRAFCVCRASSFFYAHKWEAEDWKFQHLNLVDRVHIHLRHGKDPGLRDQYNYFLGRAKDTTTPRKDRVLWQQLAAELEHRLNLSGNDDQEGLW